MSENPNGTGRGRQVGDPFVPEEPTQAVRDFFGHAFSDVAEYARMLEEEGELRGLLGPRDMERIWSRHIVNSAAVLDFMPRREGREVLDVGSGSGLPGIVIAACRPDLHVQVGSAGRDHDAGQARTGTNVQHLAPLPARHEIEDGR